MMESDKNTKVKSPAGSQAIQSGWPKLDGTFLADTVFRNWNDEDWEKEFTAYKEIGLHYLVLTSNVVCRKDGSYVVNYPTQLPGLKDSYDGRDLVDNLLRNAKKFGMKVFIGLNFDDKWWDYFWNTDFTTANRSWLYDQMKLGNQIADELYELYYEKYADAFYGWYWIWEFWNSTAMTLRTKGRMQNIQVFADCLNISLEHLTKINPNLPLFLSPYANLKLETSDQDLYHMWKDILSIVNFRNGDILCPQDSVGAGGVTFDQLEGFYIAFRKAADTKPGLRLWANNENFDQTNWSSSCLDRFVKQLEISDPYVEHHLTYSYNWCYSPVNANPGYHAAYKQYFEQGKLPVLIPESPVHVQTKSDGKNIVIQWDINGDKKKIAGFDIFRDNVFIGSTRCERNDGKGYLPELKYSFTDDKVPDPTEKAEIEYEVATVDFVGNISTRTKCCYKFQENN